MSQHQILIQEMSFNLDNNTTVFNKINLSFAKQKIGLVGINGIGKSTLLKLIMNELHPSLGSISVVGSIAYVPQYIHLTNEMTVADFLECAQQFKALHRITLGSIDECDFAIVGEDWDIERRIQEQLAEFELSHISFDRLMSDISGGELTRLMLMKALNSNADFLLLDEPTNHLDQNARQQLSLAIQAWQGGILLISHDREMLNLMDEIVELTTLGVNRYGGNYDSYHEQKNILMMANEQRYTEAKKTLDKTKRSIQSTKEKHAQRQAHGKELRRSGSQPKILLDAMKNSSEKSQGSLLTTHHRMLDDANNEILAAKESIEIINQIDIKLPGTAVPQGKMILEIEDLTFAYSEIHEPIIRQFSLILHGPTRVAIAGDNGSGKTTLVKLILEKLTPSQGKISLGTQYVSYLDQGASLLIPDMSIVENFLYLNPDANENDAYRCLASFLFRNTAALKQVKYLSGGEKLRASLACILMAKQPPQLLILDEPTNHLDIQSIESIESALKHYLGAMIVISHDQSFLKNIGIERVVYAPFNETK